VSIAARPVGREMSRPGGSIGTWQAWCRPLSGGAGWMHTPHRVGREARRLPRFAADMKAYLTKPVDARRLLVVAEQLSGVADEAHERQRFLRSSRSSIGFSERR
jgi:hypothetical protein